MGNTDWLWGKLVYVPTQLGRNEVTVWTVFGRILVHVAHDALFAEITLDAQLLDDLVDLQQDGTVEWIVVERIQWLQRGR